MNCLIVVGDELSTPASGYLWLTLLISGILLLIQLFLCIGLYRAITVLPEEHRQVDPAWIWLLLVPGLQLILNFWILRRVSTSFLAFFSTLPESPAGHCGEQYGLAYSACVLGCFAPGLWLFCAPASLAALIRYLNTINGLRDTAIEILARTEAKS